MHIAIIGSRGYPYVYSGYETFVRELSERLVAREIKVTVYCHKGLFPNRPKSVNGIQLKYIPSIETKVLSQLSHSFLAFLHAVFCKYDAILVVNSANGPFGILTRIFGIKTAINVDGLEWLRPKWKGLGAKYFYWASRLATKYYDRIINDSDEMRKIYLKHFNVDSSVIAYGASLRKSKNPELIKKWDLTSNGYFLIIGRLIPDNNADMILSGFIQSNSSRKLVIVGDVPYVDEYARKVKDMGSNDPRVVFTGYVTDSDELAELYHNAFGYLHGHEFGGTNPTMLKAMAYGSCILALETPFNREMLHGGRFGVFFEKSPDSVQQVIEEMEKNVERAVKLKEVSPRGITIKYDWDHITDAYINVFNELRA